MARHPRRPVTPPDQRTWARYARVSVVGGREGESFHSPDQQDEMGLRLIHEVGGQEGPRFYDGDASGGTMDRPQFNAAWAWLMERPYERGLVTYDLSRFGRTEDVAAWVTELETAGSALLTVKDDVTSKLVRGVMAAVNAEYRRKAGERYVDIIERRFERGDHHGTPPVGYRREGQHGPLVVDPVKAPIVREVFKRYARGDSIGSIARFYSSANGTQYAPRRIRDLVTLETYRGLVSLNGRTRPGRHEALVSDQVWQLCQARRRTTRGTSSRNLARVYVLSGLLFCAACNRRLILRRVAKGPIVVCPGPRTACKTGVGAPGLAKVEEAVLHQFAEWSIPDDSESSPEARLVAAVEEQRTLLAAAEARLTKAQEALARADTAYFSGDMDKPRYDRAVKRLRQQETVDQHAADTCRVALERAQTAAAGVLGRDQRRMLQTVVEAWPSADDEHRRRMLDSWISGVVVSRRENQREPLHRYVDLVPHAYLGTGLSGVKAFADEVAERRANRKAM